MCRTRCDGGSGPSRGLSQPHLWGFKIEKLVSRLLCITAGPSAKRGGRGREEDMCYAIRRAEAGVDESDHHGSSDRGGEGILCEKRMRRRMGAREGACSPPQRGTRDWRHLRAGTAGACRRPSPYGDVLFPLFVALHVPTLQVMRSRCAGAALDPVVDHVLQYPPPPTRTAL